MKTSRPYPCGNFLSPLSNETTSLYVRPLTCSRICINIFNVARLASRIVCALFITFGPVKMWKPHVKFARNTRRHRIQSDRWNLNTIHDSVIKLRLASCLLAMRHPSKTPSGWILNKSEATMFQIVKNAIFWLHLLNWNSAGPMKLANNIRNARMCARRKRRTIDISFLFFFSTQIARMF